MFLCLSLYDVFICLLLVGMNIIACWFVQLILVFLLVFNCIQTTQHIKSKTLFDPSTSIRGYKKMKKIKESSKIVGLPACLSICVTVCLSFCLFLCLSVCLPVCLSMYVCLCVCVQVKMYSFCVQGYSHFHVQMCTHLSML